MVAAAAPGPPRCDPPPRGRRPIASKRESECQADGDLPLRGGTGSAVTDPGIDPQLSRLERLPDEADEDRVVRPLLLDALAVYLTDHSEGGNDRQFGDQAPRPKRARLHPGHAGAKVQVIRHRPDLPAGDPRCLEADPVLAGRG